MKISFRCKRRNLNLEVGDLVYLYSERNKHSPRDRYLVVSLDNEWCNIRKFTDSQLRLTSYKVLQSDCYRVPKSAGLEGQINLMSDSETDCSDIENSNSQNKCKPTPEPGLVSVTPNVQMPEMLAYQIDDNNQSYVLDNHSTVEQSNNTSRPQRRKCPPKYLNEYVTDF